MGAFEDVGRHCVFALGALAALAISACDDTPKGLTRWQIEQTLKVRGDALKICWKANGPHGELKLHVAVTTSADGTVESAVADGKDKSVNACLEKQIKTWTFAKVESASKFTVPVNFKR